MQMTIKFGREWWLIPSTSEFSKKDIQVYEHCPYIGTQKSSKRYHFFDIQTKRNVKKLLELINQSYIKGFRPSFSYKSTNKIVWKPIKERI